MTKHVVLFYAYISQYFLITLSLLRRVHNTTAMDRYDRALARVADVNKFVVLSSVDLGYIDMAVNLYTTSIKRFNITNYLLVCSDESASRLARAHGIATFVMDRHDKNGNISSV